VAELLHGYLPQEAALRDLGQHRMKGLSQREHLFQLPAPGLRSEFPALTTLDATLRANNLPVQLTSFIGREHELAETEELLAATRLLTFTGSGGTGKTRLSLQLAERVLPAFPDGVWWVELAPLTDPAQVLPALANTLELQEQAGPSRWAVVSNYLRAKTSLLLLDNCEHLVEACARLADDLLHACPRLKILASSREALGVAGETAYRVPSLSLPEAHNVTECESARLFITRARAALSRFAVTPANAPALAKICRRLDGIPLALAILLGEIVAAARVKSMTVEQIAARLAECDRFHLLTGGSRTALPRQQTLRALIDWSYSLLSEPERVLFRRLAVFAGGWTLEAAEAVCQGGAGAPEPDRPADNLAAADILDLLTRLVDKSLVFMDEQAGAVRYHRLETIRQYAREKLFESGEAAARRGRHLDYFNQLATQAEPELRGPNVLEWLARLEGDYDNLRAAVEWGLEHDPEAALRLAGNLYLFWNTRGCYEARAWLEAALKRVEALPPTTGAAAPDRARALGRGWLGVQLLAYTLGDIAGSLQAAAKAVAAAKAGNDKITWGLAEIFQAPVSAMANDAASVQTAAEHGLALAQEIHQPVLTALSQALLAWAAGQRGDHATQQALWAELARRRAQSPDPLMVGVWIFLGLDARWRGDLDTARLYFDEVVRLARLLRLRTIEQSACASWRTWTGRPATLPPPWPAMAAPS
jgi:predicted ATPase